MPNPNLDQGNVSMGTTKMTSQQQYMLDTKHVLVWFLPKDLTFACRSSD